MAEAFNLLRRVKSLGVSTKQNAYSGVVIFAGQDDEGNNIEYRSGDATGTVLEITNEWGSQAQADAIYQKIKGYQYQPYRATGCQLDPASEIGDAVTVKDIYGGVFKKSSIFGTYVITDVEAPSKEEVEHEFQIKSPTNRRYERFTRSVRSSLSITASKIAAEVEDRKSADDLLRASINVNAEAIEARVNKESGDSSSDFWWKLLSTGWDVGTGSKTVFAVKKTGAYVDGEIRATSGKIGGFDIKSNYLSYNGQTWGGTNSTGAYIGQSGIQLGKNFKVDMQGKLTASSGTFGGTIKCDSLMLKMDDGSYETVTPKSVSSGISGGNSWYNKGSTVTANASNGAYAYGTLNGTQRDSISLNASETLSLRSGTFQMNNHNVYLGTLYVEGVEYKVLRWIE